jgi:hypothetical protein
MTDDRCSMVEEEIAKKNGKSIQPEKPGPGSGLSG